jgi:phosphoribosylglycinamide formyltransferase-1
MLNVAVLVSGGGTNLQAIIDAIADHTIQDARICLVLSNNRGVYALERARKAKIPSRVVSPGDFPDREKFNEALLAAVKESGADLVVLAGFLCVIPEKMVRAYENRILNIHPSLIPAFCGKGYYGLKVHEAALARGVRISGATVHFVDSGTDTGPIILQKAVEVLPEDTPKSLQLRIMEQAEWKILPQAIDLIAQGRVAVEGRSVRILQQAGA